MNRLCLAITVLLGLALGASACSSSGAPSQPMATDDAGPTDDAGVTDDAGPNGAPSKNYPAPFPAPPEVVTAGGWVMDRPRFVPVFFQNEDQTRKAQLIDFESKIGGTAYWRATTEEYGVGPGTMGKVVTVKETPADAQTDMTIAKWLALKLNLNDPSFPAPDENTIYVLHYPDNVTITQMGFQGTMTSCQAFAGYHSDVVLDQRHGNQLVAYAVIPPCLDVGGVTGIDSLTSTVAHELIEAASDPYPNNDPAYWQVDMDHFYWLLVLGGGENADMCAQDPSSFLKVPELPYTVQRSWSNVAAKAGHNPCVPAPSPSVEPYFNAVPELDEEVVLNFGQVITMKGVVVPVGQSKTVTIDLFSDAPTGPITVTARDAGMLTGQPATMALSLDRSSGVNGEKLHLTIKSTRASQYGASIFMLTSKVGQKQHVWFGLVGQ